MLRGIVDYAGLFPPAALTMWSAVENYAAYRSGVDAWALGRFVAPAARLYELAGAIASLDPEGGFAGWRVSALLGGDPQNLRGDLERVRAFNEGAEATRRRIAVDSLELQGSSEAQIRRGLEIAASSLGARFEVYVELPLDGQAGAKSAVAQRERSAGGEVAGVGEDEPGVSFSSDLLRLIRDAGARAKMRTGGVRPELVPPSTALLRFLRGCAEADLPFKATAGLHHAVTGRYPLTYEADSGSATMYGYLDLLFATALTVRGAPDNLILEALRESDAASFQLGEEEVAWREHRFTLDEMRRVRERGLVSFGSCSFREPLDELAVLLLDASPRDEDRAVS